MLTSHMLLSFCYAVRSRFHTLVNRGVQPSKNVSVSLLACSIEPLRVTFLCVTLSRIRVFGTSTKIPEVHSGSAVETEIRVTIQKTTCRCRV